MASPGCHLTSCGVRVSSTAYGTLGRLQRMPRFLGSLGCASGCGCSARSGLGATEAAGSVTSVLSYADAIKQAFSGDAVGGVYTAAITYAGGIAAIGNAIADFANRTGDKKSAATSALVETLTSMGLLKQVSPRPPVYLLPDLCRVVRPDDRARAVSEAIRLNKSPTELAAAFKAWIDSSTPWGGAGCTPKPAPLPVPVPVSPPPVSMPALTAPVAVQPVSLPATPAPVAVQKVSGMPTLDQQKQMASQFQSVASGATNPSSLLSAYGGIMGKVPGRLLGLSALKQVMNAVGATGGWPNVKKWKSQAVEDVFNGCKGCTPPTIPDWVRQQVAAGQTNPAQMVSAWNAHVNATWGSKWLVGTGGAIQNQLLTDIFDYEVADIAPQAPLTYAQPEAAAPPAVVPSGGGAYTPTTPAPVIPAPVATLPTQTPTTPAPVPVPVPTAPPVSASDPNLQAYIKALLDQGATQQQAFQAALQALGNSGQQITPQTQAQVADAVQSASSPIPASMIYVATGLGALALVAFALRGRKRS